jgi:serine/threonine protein kinase
MPYKTLNCLGSGFFGEVWLEQDLGLNRLCAAKYLNPARLSAGMVFAEAQVMLDGEHDNVVRVFSADAEAGIPVIRMEYLPAGSVADRYGGDPVAVADALHILEEACRGVESLHARGLLHRDLKPANLLIAEDGRIKVSDFGLACSIANLVGAPPFGYKEHLPPEALAGIGAIETAQGDVYALGVTLYRLLNGDGMMRAVAAPGANICGLIVAGKYPDRKEWQPHVHDRLRRVTRKAINCDPSRRYRSASELRHALEGVRPKVSWVPVTIAGPGLAWEGIAADGGCQCRARLSPNKQGKYLFEFERQGPSGHFRASQLDRMRGGSLKDVLPHAADVLQRVATEGK